MKNSHQKKQRDYANERRGEWVTSYKGDRRCVRRGKRRSAKYQRQLRNQLDNISHCRSEDNMWAVEADYLSKAKQQRVQGFKNGPAFA